MRYGNPRLSEWLHDGDPAPGDAEEVEAVVRKLQSAADTMNDALHLLDSLGADTALWKAPSAQAYQPKEQALRERVATAHSAYAEAAQAMSTWLPQLQKHQSSAEYYARHADMIGEQMSRDASAAFVFGTSPPELTAVQNQYEQVRGSAARDAQVCANAITDAMHQVKHFQHSAWDHFTEDLEKAKKLIDEVMPWLATLTLVLGSIPILGEVVAVLDLAVIALALVSEGMDGILLASHKESWGEFAKDSAFNALSVAGGVGGVAGKRARAGGKLDAGANAARAGADEAGAASRSEWVASVLGDGSPDKARALGDEAALHSGAAKDFAEGAHDAERNTSVIGAARSIVTDGFHPMTAMGDEMNTSELVRDAAGYQKLPLLQSWLPNGHPVASVFGTGLSVGDDVHTGTEIKKQIKDALKNAFRPPTEVAM